MPTLDAPAPVDSAPAPVDSEPAPMDGAPAPVDSAPAPVDVLEHSTHFAIAMMRLCFLTGTTSEGVREFIDQCLKRNYKPGKPIRIRTALAAVIAFASKRNTNLAICVFDNIVATRHEGLCLDRGDLYDLFARLLDRTVSQIPWSTTALYMRVLGRIQGHLSQCHVDSLLQRCHNAYEKIEISENQEDRDAFGAVAATLLDICMTQGLTVRASSSIVRLLVGAIGIPLEEIVVCEQH